MTAPRLMAISDLHVSHRGNRGVLDDLCPTSPSDWLIVAGDVAESLADIRWALSLLRDRYAKVIWAPGNHELWTLPSDRSGLRGVDRYDALVRLCAEIGVLTPEDPYPEWTGSGGPVTVASLFLLYDYSFRPDPTTSTEAALEQAYEAGVVCTDEVLLHPDPYPTRAQWCAARIVATKRRLDALPEGTRTILVNHYPLLREPTELLRWPLFAQWCGTEQTADWHLRYHTAAVVYGHLHIPRTTHHDGIPFHEVSVGYPREWAQRSHPPGARQILPAAVE